MCKYCKEKEILDDEINIDAYIEGKAIIVWNEEHDVYYDIIINFCPMCGNNMTEEAPIIRKKQPNKLKKGDLVVMHTCGEAGHYKGKIWVCSGDSETLDNEREVVFLVGFSGRFSAEYLQVVNLN